MSRSIERSRRFENIHNLINNISKILFHSISSNKRTKISSDMGQLVVPDGRTDRRTEWPVGDSSLTKPFICNTMYDSPIGTPYTLPKMHRNNTPKTFRPTDDDVYGCMPPTRSLPPPPPPRPFSFRSSGHSREKWPAWLQLKHTLT